MDYNKDSEITKHFYAAVQNKLHFAIHGQTAAELIVNRADHTKECMGLTNWDKSPIGKIVKNDVVIAKNYLTESDWEKRLNMFLAAANREVLQDAGKVSAEIARKHAETEFELFRPIQDRLFRSDFDKQLLEVEKQGAEMERAKKDDNCKR
jgi:hypothetical protein